MSGLVLFDTRTRSKRLFEPLEPGHARVYSCGPTVYSAQHIGNLRPYLFADLLKRALLAEGYRVTHVVNVTDVGHLTDDADAGEDKMELAARRSGRRAEEIAAEVHRAVAPRPPPAQLPGPGSALQGQRAHPAADRDGPRARGEGLHLPHRGRDLLRRVEVPPLRGARAARPRRAAAHRARGRRVGQALRRGLRALEVRRARRAAAAGVGLALGPRLPRLAHRVLGDEHPLPRTPVRHPHRRGSTT